MKKFVLILMLFWPAWAGAEDFLYKGTKYLDVKVMDYDAETKLAKIETKSHGEVEIPYDDLEWTLKKDCDKIRNGIDMTDKDLVGRFWIRGIVEKSTDKSAVVRCEPTRGLTRGEEKNVAIGTIAMTNYPYQGLKQGSLVKIKAWKKTSDFDGSDENILLHPVYDCKAPVLIPEREWTDAKGRKVLASLAYKDEKWVVLSVKGKLSTLPREFLSEADLAFIDDGKWKK